MTPAEKTRMLADRVMGWRVMVTSDGVPVAVISKDGYEVLVYLGITVWPGKTWSPLDNLSHAGEVLEAMRGKGWDYVASTCPTSKQHWFSFISPYHAKEDYREFYAYANKLSTAICHAALLAVGVKEKEL